MLQVACHLSNNSLFKNISPNTLQNSINFDKCTINHYKNGALIVQESDPCSAIGFILSGSLQIEQISQTGEVLTIKSLATTDAFGTALYSLPSPKYPYTIVALTDSSVIFIPFEQIQKLLRINPTFNDNFIFFLSARILNLKEKLHLLHHKDVRSRLLIYLTNEFKQNGLTTFKLSHSKSAIAEFIGVARPSVSRELKNMANEHLIILSGRTITLLKTELFDATNN